MKRASYRYGVAWIAENDEAGADDRLDPEAIGGYVSTLLLADLFGVDSERVAADILRYRRKLDERENAMKQS